ncbi:MAG: hypothetical protein UR25_C0006G0007 [Candidatus Nomurabacteria bacterium GW2011_GWE1_32_28]|uniref:Uncharacterized protein n=1 Tax=Candidatus Nomurabacteria bacterium GW2011_GWF1_31_48 TaxID=1618767 RepID=A0A0G0AT18_9BACT|nr:MAG: hypothetical protein UR10_C0006G0004 [Candidatus Nomurabacteria bacterium GW2011_GWF2_30_133]KKP28208.1 MAG: hypothetical protein UR18_C0008G0007 [Candidatus Nomurabacteria bacterium GW2011_GWE2_31_40]KKP29860.1 MAG: hypothetical protein UR19_C0007G0034 [Candidatus Nomurabacteria bacterium GW2011_GWF1_31_48]KKP34509.1 MAG: hypothetical protein UR25_C0006G0007 [Candidatus Nomurabacteria bacterium GW2011_GWE1_32_28]HAS80415.1 hypothetical protein [Candidatus Nomurabacteria bacterium]
MNKTKKMILGLGTLALILGVSGAITSQASAYKGDPAVKGPNYSIERHTAMEKAFETNDYTAWKSLMNGQGRVSQVVNQDNFAKFAEAHKLAENGDLAGAKKVREELGLGLKNGSGQAMGNKLGRGMNRNNITNR